MNNRSKKATVRQAFGPLAVAILVFLAIRWIGIEPYTIPSGSMLPSLLLHDYVVVDKSAYGLRVPFTSFWFVQWARPNPGDVVVFRAPDKSGMFFIKRVVGVSGDKIEWTANGKLRINDQWVEPGPASIEDLRYGHPSGQNLPPQNAENQYQLVQQKIGNAEFLAWLRRTDNSQDAEDILDSATVPEGHFFVIGDNRPNSYDSRYFGPISMDELLGKGLSIVLSCGGTVQETATICDPKTIRWDRWFKAIR